MSFFSFFFSSSSKKEVKRDNPKIKDLKLENVNIWVEDITKITIEISSLLNILNMLDLQLTKLMKYTTLDIIDLDPYRLPYIKFLRLKLKENPQIKKVNISTYQKLISNIEKELKIKNTNIKRSMWVDNEVIDNNVDDFIRNRFYNNSDIKMFLLKYITNEDRKYKLFINDKNNIIIDHSIKHFKPNKQIIKRIKGFIINIKGNTIYLNKVTILRILKQSKIKENKIINTITYFTKHLKQNYEILIKYHKEFYPNKLKKKLNWIKNKDEISVKIKNKNISKFEDLIIKAEEYYNMVIEDENRRLREVGLLFPIKRSRSGDLRSNDIMKKIREKNEVNSKNSLDSTDNDTDINQYKKNENKDFNAISKHNEKEKKNDGSNLSGSKLRKNKLIKILKLKMIKEVKKIKKKIIKILEEILNLKN